MCALRCLQRELQQRRKRHPWNGRVNTYEDQDWLLGVFGVYASRSGDRVANT